MSNESLAEYSNLVLYSAMFVLVVAMIAYAAYLAALVTVRELTREAASPSRESVDAGVSIRGISGSDMSGSGRSANDAQAAPRSGSMSTSGAVRADPSGTDADPATGASDGSAVSLGDRAARAGGIAVSLSWLGTALLVGSVVMRGASVSRWPLGNMFEFAVFAAMFTMIAYLGLDRRRDVRWLGLFTVSMVLVILGLAVTSWYTEASELVPSLNSVWLIIHVTVATLAIGLFTIGALLALLYLAKDRWPQQKYLDALPSATALERLTYWVHIVGFPLWSFTLIAGSIWARQAWGAYWQWDPKEVWTFVIWVIYAAYLHARATTGWRRQSATWVAIAGFVGIIINYTVVNIFLVGMHSYSGM